MRSGTTEKYGTWDLTVGLESSNLCGNNFVLGHKMTSLANIIKAYLVTYINKLVTLSRTLPCQKHYSMV